mmetsp:Transcript_49316/g.155043  ORF Transcript_49316/g.155043 Transcript_49316/m.155043 type:complete len:205 (-) Transcript_49316:303-917(-)
MPPPSAAGCSRPPPQRRPHGRLREGSLPGSTQRGIARRCRAGPSPHSRPPTCPRPPPPRPCGRSRMRPPGCRRHPRDLRMAVAHARRSAGTLRARTRGARSCHPPRSQSRRRDQLRQSSSGTASNCSQQCAARAGSGPPGSPCPNHPGGWPTRCRPPSRATTACPTRRPGPHLTPPRSAYPHRQCERCDGDEGPPGAAAPARPR